MKSIEKNQNKHENKLSIEGKNDEHEKNKLGHKAEKKRYEK